MKTSHFFSIFNVQCHLRRQALSVIPSGLVSLSSGMTFGITAVMLPQLRVDQTIQYDAAHESWIAAIASLCMIIGCLVSGPILDHFGRKTAITILGFPYIIGWTIIGCAPSTAIIILGRFFTGLSSGAYWPVMMVYIGEMASPEVRRVALSAPIVLSSIGILLSHLFGYYYNWRTSAFICIVPAILISVTSLFLRESPLWLISKGKTEEGIDHFRWFRGTDDASEAELKTILEKQLVKPKMTVKEISNVACSGAFIKPTLILFVVMINIPFAGVTDVSFYAQDIFREIFSGKIDPFIMMIAMDCIVGVMSAVACVLRMYVSKRKSYLTSNFGISISIAGLVACLLLGSDRFVWVSVLCLVIFFCFSAPIFIIGFTFVPEMLPNSARGFGSGLCSAFASIGYFTIVKITPDIIKLYGVATVFAIYGVTTFICGLILCFTLPETDGKTLQSIEDSYSAKKTETPL